MLYYKSLKYNGVCILAEFQHILCNYYVQWISLEELLYNSLIKMTIM